MDVENEDVNEESSPLSNPPRLLQIVAGVVLLLGAGAALAYYAPYVFASEGHSSGWGIASATFYLVNSAVYAPALLLGFVALLLVRSDERRDQAIKLTRLIMIAAVLLILSGVAEMVCLAGQALSDESYWISGWSVAGQAFTFMANVVFESGVLLGLVYVFRQLERKCAARQLSGNH